MNRRIRVTYVFIIHSFIFIHISLIEQVFIGLVLTFIVLFLQICPSSSPSPVEAIQHLKTHGLMLYQCTWCVYGAENEAELLQHASAKHPSKIPQAYLRVITQKVSTFIIKLHFTLLYL